MKTFKLTVADVCKSKKQQAKLRKYLKQKYLKDKPVEGKTYLLTGGPKDKCIANGNSWSESELIEKYGWSPLSKARFKNET